MPKINMARHHFPDERKMWNILGIGQVTLLGNRWRKFLYIWEDGHQK